MEFLRKFISWIGEIWVGEKPYLCIDEMNINDFMPLTICSQNIDRIVNHAGKYLFAAFDY